MTAGLTAALTVDRGGFRLRADIAVPEGRVVALLGRNGAGKSTAVAAIAGVTPLTAGQIVLGGVVLDDPATGRFVPPERRPVGTVLQQAALFPHLTVRGNVAFGLRTAGFGRRAAADRAATLLWQAGLADLSGRRPAALSGGQAARVALVRTLARRPALLLLDEPLAAIDAEARPALRAAIRDALTAFDGAALLVTHDVADAEALADDVVVLDEGEVVQSGTLAAVRASPATPAIARLVGPASFPTPAPFPTPASDPDLRF